MVFIPVVLSFLSTALTLSPDYDNLSFSTNCEAGMSEFQKVLHWYRELWACRIQNSHQPWNQD